MRTLLLFVLVATCLCCKTKGTLTDASDTPSTIDSDDCYPDRKVVYQHTDVDGRIGKVGDYYIIHHGEQTGRLQPCALPTKYQVEDLRVIFSGDQVEINPGERRFAMPLRLRTIEKIAQ